MSRGEKGEGKRGAEKRVSVGCNVTVKLTVDTEFSSHTSVNSGICTEIGCPSTEDNC